MFSTEHIMSADKIANCVHKEKNFLSVIKKMYFRMRQISLAQTAQFLFTGNPRLK
ncbi:hypothetical protein ABIE50_004330 [Chitinophaga sp. OAE865]